MHDDATTAGITAARASERPSDDLATNATRELAMAFAAAIQNGDAATLVSILHGSVAYQMPGRSHHAGIHRGRDHVLAKLTVPAAPGTTVHSAAVTEAIADGHRAFVTVALDGSVSAAPFALEVGFHLQTDGESIVGITEYSGDQYVVDSMLGVDTSVSTNGTSSIAERSSRRRWWNRRR